MPTRLLRAQEHLLTWWLRIQALVWLPFLAVAAVGGTMGPAVPRLVAAAVVLSLLALMALLGTRRLADGITAFRSAVLLAPLLLPAAGGEDWRTFGLFAAASALDLADGAVARRRGPTAAGAVLDMEADQFLVLVLSWLHREQGGAAWVLLLPALRYLYVAAMLVLRLPAHEPKPVGGDNRRGRRICALVVAALLAAHCPAVPAALADAGTAAAVLLLGWSFAQDARFLLARGRTA